MTKTSAKIIADSVSPDGVRLTSIEATFHRFVLAEVNTHRAFSRNSASSRARPIRKVIEELITDPALPIEFGTAQKGMQAGPRLEADKESDAIEVWLEALDNAVRAAGKLEAMGVHKQVANRLLEPFMWHTAIITSTEWENFLAQRDSVLAQPEIALLAQDIRITLETSEPTRISYENWHTPYIQDDEIFPSNLEKIRVSAARCARVSYLTQDGKRLIEKDLELYNRLISANPPHWSPLEHVATPAGPEDNTEGNFQGWKQLRHLEHYQ